MLACARCAEPGSKKCSRCGSEVYCSAECQRLAWPSHKLVCRKAETPENAIAELLRGGRIFSAKHRLSELPKANSRLAAELERLAAAGIHSEIVEGRLRLEEIPGMGKGYVAATDIAEGVVLLFDTAFVSVPIKGKDEWHFRIAEKAIAKGTSPKRRNDALVDAQCDFFYGQIRDLCTKVAVTKEWLDEVDPDMATKILLCSIAEANCFQCSEAPEYMALFAAASRLNHSCEPNAIEESTRTTILVRSLRPIPAGEEVTISYLPRGVLGLESVRRREALLQARSFECRCRVCAAEGASDAPTAADGAEDALESVD